MSFYKIIGFAVTGLIIIIVMRRLKDEYAFFISLLLGTCLMVCAVGILAPVIEYLREISVSANASSYLSILFKTAGIALITTLAADMCRDCGEASLSSKVELCGKSTILLLSLPLIKAVFENVFDLLK